MIENGTKSRMIAGNLNIMHNVREDFFKNGNNEKLRRALLHQVRSFDIEDFSNDDDNAK